MTASVGDLAAEQSRKLQEDHVHDLMTGARSLHDEHETMVRENSGQAGSKLRGKGSIMDRIRFGWRPDDELIMAQIRAGAETAFTEMYGDALYVIDRLYESVRLPKERNGKIVRDANGRTVWETDEHGLIVQDWDNLTGQDIETALFNIQEIRFYIAPRLNELLLEAIYAKHVHEDTKFEAYSSVVEGTIGDREARANRESKTDKYSAFYRYYLWSQGDVFMRELQSFQRILERVRDWRVRSQRG